MPLLRELLSWWWFRLTIPSISSKFVSSLKTVSEEVVGLLSVTVESEWEFHVAFFLPLTGLSFLVAWRGKGGTGGWVKERNEEESSLSLLLERFFIMLVSRFMEDFGFRKSARESIWGRLEDELNDSAMDESKLWASLSLPER